MGRITLLIDSPLRTLMLAMAGLEREIQSQIAKHTKGAAQPIWSESLIGHAGNKLQTRLAESGRVGVTQQNVFLRAGAVGRFSNGTPLSRLAAPIEFGAKESAPVKTKSRTGTAYTRRLGNAFGAPARGGNVFYPAVREAISRVVSLWIQTAHRTVHEELERM